MTETSFAFWTRWLAGASASFCVFGIVVALWPDAPWLAPWTDALATTFYDGAEPEAAAAVRRFLLAPLGATIAGSYLLQTAIALGPFARREPWAWWVTLAALLVWFVLDSALSLLRDAAFNVWMINLTPLVVFLPPLLATRRAFAAPRSHGIP